MNSRRPIPNGFAERANEPTKILTKEFHCNTIQCKRWREEIGIHKEGRRQPRPVVCFTRDGDEVARYKSILDAQIAINGYASNICAALKGRAETAYGYVWKYAEG